MKVALVLRWFSLKYPEVLFFYLGFLSRTFTNHRTAGEGGGHFFNSSLLLSPASLSSWVVNADSSPLHIVSSRTRLFNYLIWFPKVVSATFLLVCFLSLNESTCQTRKMFFILHQNICSLSRNSKFRILDIQILWRHQMPKHKIGNTFYWIMWKVSSLLMKYEQFISYHKRRYLIKNYTKTASWKLVLGPFVFPKN